MHNAPEPRSEPVLWTGGRAPPARAWFPRSGHTATAERPAPRNRRSIGVRGACRDVTRPEFPPWEGIHLETASTMLAPSKSLSVLMALGDDPPASAP
ncbi:hypothetical protein GCM10017567_57440 [Amycolatopsis bullii]|uniref:Uncharacterized protein n=1 Tax=Amycolatopsis bullii TaxID=941987 RepID=A0ABQ3KIX3_9PSEU|nr:hypothetical protein GCM10017567_57440 [Amycolatopsis bullii]